MSTIPHLVGMVHLPALPGSPRYGGSMGEVLDIAASDASGLLDAGFPALLVENFGDSPFFPDRVPAETVAAMSLALRAVIEESGLPVGVNVLRNDALSALAVAAATGASFIRVNVLSGVMYIDQGMISGRAAEVLRKRSEIASEVEIWADAMVKHATPPPGLQTSQAVRDLVARGLADAVIVSGSGTGAAPAPGEVRDAREAMPKGTRLVIGSGANHSNIGPLSEIADTVIVGSSLKVDGDPTSRVDPDRAALMVAAAVDCGLL